MSTYLLRIVRNEDVVKIDVHDTSIFYRTDMLQCGCCKEKFRIAMVASIKVCPACGVRFSETINQDRPL